MRKKVVEKSKDKNREINLRSKPMPMEERIKKLINTLIGWCGYFALADTPSMFKEFDEWIRRRLRMCLWKAMENTKNESKETQRI